MDITSYENCRALDPQIQLGWTVNRINNTVSFLLCGCRQEDLTWVSTYFVLRSLQFGGFMFLLPRPHRFSMMYCYNYSHHSQVVCMPSNCYNNIMIAGQWLITDKYHCRLCEVGLLMGRWWRNDSEYLPICIPFIWLKKMNVINIGLMQIVYRCSFNLTPSFL